MAAGEVETVVRTLLMEEFKVEEDAIRPEATLHELGLDSLDIVSFAMAVEDRFGIRIPEPDLEGVETVGDALRLLDEKVGART
jgi:acyl carrier protein